MTDTILRKQSQITSAETATLLATYNALTGKSIKRFSSRVAAERQVEMAMLSAQDADAHTGVPKGAAPRVITADEAAAKLSESAPAPDGEDGGAPLSFVPGSLADQLDKATHHTAPIVPRVKKPAAPSVARKTLMHVLATGAGTSKVQPTSTRGEVMAFVAAAPAGWTSVAELDAKFNCNTKGYLQKLIEMNHLAPCDAGGQPLAAPGAPAAMGDGE